MFEIGSEFDWESNTPFLISLESRTSSFPSNSQFFRSGRDALRSIAKNHQGSHRDVWLPALNCESMALPFRQTGFFLHFYDPFSISETSSNFLDTNSSSSAIFVYMTYFGFPTINSSFLSRLSSQSPRTVFVEDSTHSFFYAKERPFIPDYEVMSIRKWLAIPDGGIAIPKGAPLPSVPASDLIFSGTRKQALQEKSRFLIDKMESCKESFREKFAFSTHLIDSASDIACISPESWELLKKIDFSAMLNIRKKNVRFLFREFSRRWPDTLFSGFEYDLPLLYFPILIKYRDRFQRELSQRGIYCPIIWPLPKGAEGVSEMADSISAHMLALPCDHRYSTSEMDIIVHEFQDIWGKIG